MSGRLQEYVGEVDDWPPRHFELCSSNQQMQQKKIIDIGNICDRASHCYQRSSKHFPYWCFDLNRTFNAHKRSNRGRKGRSARRVVAVGDAGDESGSM